MGKGYIKQISENVNVEELKFKNRYGLNLAGDLFYIKDIDKSKKYSAIIVGPPYGGVKEQGPSIYANVLAQKGYVVLTFDPPFMGESEGKERNISSPELFTESFSAGVDFLGTKVEFVDREKIGVIGICGSGTFAINAAAMDTRIKAVVTSAMVDMSAAPRFEATSKEKLFEIKDKLSRQRWIDSENGKQELINPYPETPVEKVPDGMNPMWAEFFSFYGLKRGHHPNARGGFTTTSTLTFIGADLLERIDEISPRPIMFVTGTKAHSKNISEEAYEKALEPKELVVAEDATHIDLYDDTEKIPFDKIDEFFRKSLN